MLVELWLKEATMLLEKAGIATARLDCLVLLEDVTAKDRTYLLAYPEATLQSLALKRLNKQIERRKKHEPLAYIRGKSEFYGREFIVSPDTLQPRPETETMIDLLKSHLSSLLQVRPVTGSRNVNWTVVDVGTGSGCIGITAKLELPDLTVVATDISEACLVVAEQNAHKFSADVKFFQGDLLEPLLKSKFSNLILLCNLPYVPDSHTVNQAAMQEPAIAIFGGQDGLGLYRRLFKQIGRLAHKPLFIFTESLPFQHEKLAEIAAKQDYELRATNDFIQLFHKPR